MAVTVATVVTAAAATGGASWQSRDRNGAVARGINEITTFTGAVARGTYEPATLN